MKHDSFSVGFPRNTDTAAIIALLSGEGSVRAEAPVHGLRQWLDSHDWRVHGSGQMLERYGSAGRMRLRLSRPAEPGTVFETHSPEHSGDVFALPSSVLQRRLAGTLGLRTLLARCEVSGTVQVLNVLDRREKTVVRAEIWRPRRRGDLFVRITPLRGYAATARRLAKSLRRGDGARRDEPDPLLAAAATLDIAPGDYPPWQFTGLAADARTDDALMSLLAHYARIMDLNVVGMGKALDSEFLHQFRIGIRRSRALLRHSPGTLAAGRLRPLVDNLVWLGAQTSVVRDADVHALVFPDYIAALAPSDREALTPMMDLVADERMRAQCKFAATIDSHRFRSLWRAWLRFVSGRAPRASRQPMGRQPLCAVAPGFIAASARTVVRRGRRIDNKSAPQAYHDVRKSCKNMRYMIDAYGIVIPGKSLKQAVKSLKSLQELLGEHQDLDVHHGALRELHQVMARTGDLPGETHRSMEALLTSMSARAQAIRERFPHEFAAFREAHLSRSLLGKRQ